MFRIFLQEIFVLEDCTYYSPQTYTTVTTVDIALPQSFELTFKVHRTQSTQNSSYLEIGGNTGNTALAGQIGATGMSRLRLYNSEGSSSYTDTSVSDNPINQDTLYTWIKNGSDNTFSMNNSSASVSNSLTHSKIRMIRVTNNQLKEIKVKAL